MVAETRSSHEQSYTQRPSYPQLSTPSAQLSTSQSVFQSSSSVASVSSLGTPQQQLQSPGMLSQQTPFSAPLPSPSTQQQPASYFGSLAHTSHPQSLPRIPAGQQHQTGGYTGQRGAGGGVPETQPFLQDFNLVAEAAKRAQMACLARDLGDVSL